MAKFQFKPLVGIDGYTTRFGAGTGPANVWTDAEVGKPVKLAGDSRYDLCAAGDDIEAFVVVLEGATADGYTIGTIGSNDFWEATVAGATLVVGDYVVAGANGTKGTPLPNRVPVVQKGTPVYFPWRVESLGAVGTGVAGSTVVIRRVTQ